MSKQYALNIAVTAEELKHKPAKVIRNRSGPPAGATQDSRHQIISVAMIIAGPCPPHDPARRVAGDRPYHLSGARWVTSLWGRLGTYPD
jgi:hypothetical protein